MSVPSENMWVVTDSATGDLDQIRIVGSNGQSYEVHNDPNSVADKIHQLNQQSQ